MKKLLKQLYEGEITKEVFFISLISMFVISLLLINWNFSKRLDNNKAHNSMSIFEDNIIESSPSLELPDSHDLLREIQNRNVEISEKDLSANKEYAQFLSDNLGNRIVIVFWADWDYNSIRYLEELNGLSSAPNLGVVAISQGEIDKTVFSRINKNNYDFKIIEDTTGQMAIEKEVFVIPTTIFLDQNHNQFSVKEGTLSQNKILQTVIRR